MALRRKEFDGRRKNRGIWLLTANRPVPPINTKTYNRFNAWASASRWSLLHHEAWENAQAKSMKWPV
jgi:hypothetical protein